VVARVQENPFFEKPNPLGFWGFIGFEALVGFQIFLFD